MATGGTYTFPNLEKALQEAKHSPGEPETSPPTVELKLLLWNIHGDTFAGMAAAREMLVQKVYSFVGQNLRVSGKFPISRIKLSRMGRRLHVVIWSHLILLRITKIAEGWSHTVFTPALEATTSTRTFGKLLLVSCLPCQREPGNIHDPYAMAVVETGVATRIVGHVLCHIFGLLSAFRTVASPLA